MKVKLLRLQEVNQTELNQQFFDMPEGTMSPYDTMHLEKGSVIEPGRQHVSAEKVFQSSVPCECVSYSLVPLNDI